MNKTQLIQSLKQRGFSAQILAAFEKVKREDFLPNELKKHAYEDIALPIAQTQTISQPYTIAMMLSLLDLKKGQKVLEIGSGSGYVLALISEIIGNKGKVYGIERIKQLAEHSRKSLANYNNVKVYNKNGMQGLPEQAPFDRIIISAGYQEIPPKLISQLKNNGIIVAPLGIGQDKSLTSFKKINNKLTLKKEFPGFVFVPLLDD